MLVKPVGALLLILLQQPEPLLRIQEPSPVDLGGTDATAARATVCAIGVYCPKICFLNYSFTITKLIAIIKLYIIYNKN